MDKTSKSNNGAKSKISAVEKIIYDAKKFIDTQSVARIDIFTGLSLELTGHTIRYANNEIYKCNAIYVNLSKIKTETYVSLIALLPISPNTIIDKNEEYFDYDIDDLYNRNYLSLEIGVGQEKGKVEKALRALAAECKRILLLYGNTISTVDSK